MSQGPTGVSVGCHRGVMRLSKGVLQGCHWECYRVVSWGPQVFLKAAQWGAAGVSLGDATRVLLRCRRGVTRLSQGVPQGYHWGCCRGFTRVPQGCYWGATGVLQGYPMGLPQGCHRGCYRGVSGDATALRSANLSNRPPVATNLFCVSEMQGWLQSQVVCCALHHLTKLMQVMSQHARSSF